MTPNLLRCDPAQPASVQCRSRGTSICPWQCGFFPTALRCRGMHRTVLVRAKGLDSSNTCSYRKNLSAGVSDDRPGEKSCYRSVAAEHGIGITFDRLTKSRAAGVTTR